MKTRRVGLVAIGAVVTAAIFLGTPALSHAVTINSVTVQFGANIWSLWTFPVTLNPSQTLVLAQTDGFNFDTSDRTCSPGPCPSPTVTVTFDSTNTQIFTDATKLLSMNNADPNNPTFNEAANYVLIGPPNSLFEVFVGYADNVHSNPCGSGAMAVGFAGEPNCLPSPFNGQAGDIGPTTIATFFQGAGAANPGITGAHCGVGGASNCWDSGLVQIHALSAIPAPPTVILVGLGLSGVGGIVWRRRRS